MIFSTSLLLVSCGVLLFASVVSEKAAPVDLIMGKYGRTMENAGSTPGGGVCSPSIEHRGTPNTNSAGDLFLQRSNIYHSGQVCGSESMLLKFKPKNNIVSGVGKSVEIYKKLSEFSEYFWVGKEARTCGVGSRKWVLPNPTAMFLSYDTKKDIPGPFGITLAKNIRYLIITNSKYTCVYRGVPKNAVVDPTAPPAIGNLPGPTDGNPTDAESTNENTVQGESVCFPARALVLLEDGSIKRMDRVTIGDRVHVGGGKYSQVFFFTHKQKDVTTEFIDLGTASGESISLTPGHYLYVNGCLAAAATVKVGDTLRRVDRNNMLAAGVVKVITRSRKEGLYNPQTIHGDIVVDGIIASTFTTAVEPAFAVAALAPLRSLYTQMGIFVEGLLDSGSEALVQYIPKGEMKLADAR